MAHTKKQKEEFLNVLIKKGGHVGRACTAFGISRMTFYRWLKEEWFEERYNELLEAEIDDAEETLRMLRKGVPKRNKKGEIVDWLIPPNTAATIFYLKTKGKKRGYVERQEITGADGTEIKINFKDAK